MPESPTAKPGRTGPRWSWPAGLLGMLVMVTGLEGLIASRALDLTSPATLTWKLSGEAARGEAQSCHLLGFGSSLLKHGVLPGVLEPELGGPVFNLAVCAAQPPAHYYLLKQALEAGARPETILVGFAPDLLTGGPEHNLRNWPEFLNLSDCLDLARSDRNAELFAQLALGRLFPSYRCRHEIRDLIQSRLDGRDDSPKTWNRLYQRHWTVNRGGQYTPTNPAFHGEVTDAEHQTLLSDRFWCHRLNRHYIHRFLKLAESQRVRVFWLLPPVSPALQARRDSSGAEAQYERFIREIQAEHPELIVLDARRSGYQANLFQDARHLVADGTLALSKSVASAVTQDGATRARWVTLPPFQTPDLENRALEDVDQSRLALQDLDSSKAD